MIRRQPKTPEQKREQKAKRAKRMQDMGVKKKRHLSFIPLLIAAMAVVVWLKVPSYATHQFAPVSLTEVPPMSSIAVSAKIDPAAAQGAQLAYAQLTWRDLEAEQGVYDFDRFEAENHFDMWREIGVGIILNFCMDVPGSEAHTDLPQWLYEAIEGDGVAYEEDGLCGFSPNYANALLRECHHDAIRALGERYDEDPAIAVVEIGSVGRSGLWKLPDGQQLPAASVMTAYAQEYVHAFSDTPLTCAVRYDVFVEEHMQIGCLNTDVSDEAHTWSWINRNRYGGYDSQIRQEVAPADPQRTGGVWGAHIPEGAELAEMSPEEFQRLLQRLKEGNASYLYGADFSDLSPDRQLALNSTLGYTLWLRRVQLPTHISPNYRLRINMTWQNDGSSAMICDWPLEIALYQDGRQAFAGHADFDMRTLQPGVTECYVTVDLPPDLPDGEYDVTVAIIDPSTGLPAVELAMDCRLTDGRSVIGSLEVR